MPMWIFSAIGFAKDNWKVLAVAVAAIILLVYVESLRVDILQKENQITKLQADNATLQHNVDTLEGSLKFQNAAIDKIDGLAKLTQQSFSKLGVDVANQGSSLNNTLTNILKEKKPVTCEDTIKYLIEAQKGYAK